MDAFCIVFLFLMCFFVFPVFVMNIYIVFDKIEEEIKRRKEAKDGKKMD